MIPPEAREDGAPNLCQVCERSPATRTCPLDCRYCDACARELEQRCRNCGGELTALAAA